MKDVLIGFSFIFSGVAFISAILALRFVHRVFTIIKARKSRTVVVDMTDGKVTVVREWSNDTIDVPPPN